MHYCLRKEGTSSIYARFFFATISKISFRKLIPHGLVSNHFEHRIGLKNFPDISPGLDRYQRQCNSINLPFCCFVLNNELRLVNEAPNQLHFHSVMFSDLDLYRRANNIKNNAESTSPA